MATKSALNLDKSGVVVPHPLAASTGTSH
jgi:hypothetical protein